MITFLIKMDLFMHIVSSAIVNLTILLRYFIFQDGLFLNFTIFCFPIMLSLEQVQQPFLKEFTLGFKNSSEVKESQFSIGRKNIRKVNFTNFVLERLKLSFKEDP